MRVWGWDRAWRENGGGGEEMGGRGDVMSGIERGLLVSVGGRGLWVVVGLIRGV